MSNNEEKRLIAADERRRHSYFENQSKQLRADLARIEVAVTFLHGRFDQMRVHERSFVASTRKGRLAVLPYGTHMVNLNMPERFNADLLRVLARASAPPTLGS